MEQRIYVENNRFSKKHYTNFDRTLRAKGVSRKINDHKLIIQDDSTFFEIDTLTKIKEYIHQYPTQPLCNGCIDREYTEDVLDTVEYTYDLPVTLKKFKRTVKELNTSSDGNEIGEIGENATFTLQQEIEYAVNESKVYYIYLRKHSRDVKGLLNSTLRYSFNVRIPFEEEDTVLKCIKFLHFAIDGNILPLDKQTQENVCEKYFSSTKGLFIPSQIKDVDPKEPILITPKPATLERVNLLAPSLQRADVSVLENYALSEKADGERFLLYIDEDGNGYLINSNRRVRGTGLKLQGLSNSLFDGELIMCSDRKDKAGKDLFLIFDVYLLKGEDTMKLPLLSGRGSGKEDNRMARITEAVTLLGATSTHEFVAKRHLEIDNTSGLFAVAKQVIYGTYPYAIDGLILTPSKLPVFAQYTNRPTKVRRNVRWDKVFKWKPPEQNTIDFLVEATGKEYSNDGVRVREFKLRVGYNKENVEAITVKEGVTTINGFRSNPSSIAEHNSGAAYRFEDYVVDGTVQMAHITINPADNNCYTDETGELILDKMVVEFKYNKVMPLIAQTRRWIPNRIRYDKNESVAEGKVSKTANDIEVAMNIWRSINAPISIENITGVQQLEQNELLNAVALTALATDDRYYNREKKNMLISSPMIYFHNHVIKSMLYKFPPEKSRKTLLELGCGQGSDLSRWVRSGYRKVVGIDYVRDNIVNPVNGIYRRVLDMYKAEASKGFDVRRLPDMLFLVGDCKLPLYNGKSASAIENNRESIDFMRIALGGSAIGDRYKRLDVLQRFSDLHKDGFDVVSCQFTIHYFCDSERSLDGFLYNVASHLKQGGMFIATYMDGSHVHGLLHQSGTAEGRDSVSNSVVWQIVARYNWKQQTNKVHYGKAIDVYIENTGKLITENMVYTDVLKKKAEEKGLSVVATQMFKETLNSKEVLEQFGNNKQVIEEFMDDPTLMRFSALNRWVVFKKD